eukprot:5554937-Prymnesium_polylepis.1
MAVVWESWNSQLAQWTALSSFVSHALERVFMMNAMNGVVAGLLFDADQMEYPPKNPVRRAGNDSGVTCQYHDGYAWCVQNPFVSTLIADAKAAGRQTTHFYLTDNAAYDVCLSEPCSQTRVTNQLNPGTNRAIYIPTLPSVADDVEPWLDSPDSVT